MSGYALLLPDPGPPQVLPDAGAQVAAMREGRYQFLLLDWSPTPERVLGVHGHTGDPGAPDNRSARALTGVSGCAFCGPVLVTGHRTSGELSSLTEFDLLVIGTRLLIGELSDRAIAG